MTQPDLQSILNLRRRYRAYIEDLTRVSPAQRYAGELTGVAIGVVLIVVGFAAVRDPWGMVAIAVVLFVLAIASALNKHKSEDGRLKIAQSGVPVWGVLVQANSMLFQPGNTDLPCLVLFSFEPAGGHIEYMQRLAAGIFDLKNVRQSDPDLRYVSTLVTNESALKYRRRKLPISFTGGPTVYCADLIITRSSLPAGYITEKVLPCIAEPGESGALELLPWWLAAGKDNPDRL